MFIALSSLCYATYSTDRTDYYWDGTYYITDGLNIADIALNGNQAYDDDLITSYGWSILAAVSSPTYQNTQVSLGDVSMFIYNTGSSPWGPAQANYDMPDNASWVGMYSYKIYLDSGTGNKYLRLYPTTGNTATISKDTLTSSTHFGFIDGGSWTLCDENSIAISADNWNNVTWDATSGIDTVAYINGQMCHNFTGNVGLAQITFEHHGDRGAGQFWVDEMWLSNGERPLTLSSTLSNPICTSCDSGTNNTLTSTPTFNVTCSNCQMVRISNNSAYNFSNATSSRNCTVGAGTDWVCTLITDDQLNQYNTPQPIYFWGNGTNGYYHTIFNLTMNVTLIEESNLSYNVHPCYNSSIGDLGGCFAINWSLAYDQINWSLNSTINGGNFSWNFTEFNISPVGSYLFNLTNNRTRNITIQLKLNTTNPSIWQLFYNDINLTSTSFVNLLNLTANTTKRINLTLNLYNISQIYINWSLYKSTAGWGFNYTINISGI